MSDVSSHAFVLPDDHFFDWYRALRPYLDHFERVAVVRGIGGNDLNPYRHVSAVTVKHMWIRDDPHLHIRRIYPSVVLIDEVHATTPHMLAEQMQTRIANDDRFGKLEPSAHLHERFVIGWATRHRPYRIVRPFTTVPSGDIRDVLGLEIASQAGSKVFAARGGTVSKQWNGTESDALQLGKYVQIVTKHQGEQYTITYAGLSNINVPLHVRVEQGQEIGIAKDDHFSVIVQATTGLSGYRLPNIVNPNTLIYIDDLRVRPIGSGLRVRNIPTVNGGIIGMIQPHDYIIPREPHGRVLAKTGVEGKWINIRLPDGRTGYTAAWFLEATEFRRFALDINPVGVNLDIRHPLGKPEPHRLGKLGWLRFGYNVSNRVGSEDIQAAYERYAPAIERYVEAGYRICFTTSHQTYGEAQGFPVWRDMTDTHWQTLIQRFADMMARIARQWAGTGFVSCWQIWNEQDAPIGAEASVPMSAKNYGRMLDQVIPAIRATDQAAYLISGGLTSGPTLGAAYIRRAINSTARGQQLDGIAFHPYGRGTNLNSVYAHFGHIDDSIRAYGQVFPDKPLWITEWGVLNRPQDNPTDIANYALNMINYLKARYSSKIAALIWYAWAQGMHNGYGIVDQHSRARYPLTERFLNI